MYGVVKNVAYEYYRDAQFANVKTGRRLVFIDFYEECGAPPFCIVRGQKISVSYRGRRPICYHCNTEGHTKANCPINKFKTCYSCGSPNYEQIECWEPTFVAYFFAKNKQYPLYCYPTDYQSEDLEEETIYGLIQNVEEARIYNLTFDPYFYTPDAAECYREATYDDNDPEQEAQDDENEETIRGIWESDKDENTEENETEEYMDTDKTEKAPKATPGATNPASTMDKKEPKKKTKLKKTTPNQKQHLPKEKTPQTQPQKQTPLDAPNTSNANSSPQEQNPAKQTENQHYQTTATKRKLQTNSLQVHQKKTKDTAAANKDTTDKEHTVVINGKACVQRNLDFSGGQQQSKIPVSKQVRTGRTPGNRGTSSETRPRQWSQSRHREAGSVEGRGQDSC